MSKKKKRKAAPARTQGKTLADQQATKGKRLNSAARSMLLFDLVFLAVCQLLELKGVLSPLASGIATIVGLILLICALWLQFGKKPTTTARGDAGRRLR